MNEDQLAVAEFAADLAAGLGYVDKQTTNRPSQQPPALKTDPKAFIKNLVQQTRNVPSNQQQLVQPQPQQPQIQVVQPIPNVQPIFQEPVVQPLPLQQQMVVGNIQSTAQKEMQLELSFDVNEKKELLDCLKSIDSTLKKALVFLNENYTKKRQKYVE